SVLERESRPRGMTPEAPPDSGGAAARGGGRRKRKSPDAHLAARGRAGKRAGSRLSHRAGARAGRTTADHRLLAVERAIPRHDATGDAGLDRRGDTERLDGLTAEDEGGLRVL